MEHNVTRKLIHFGSRMVNAGRTRGGGAYAMALALADRMAGPALVERLTDDREHGLLSRRRQKRQKDK